MVQKNNVFIMEMFVIKKKNKAKAEKLIKLFIFIGFRAKPLWIYYDYRLVINL